VEVEVFQVSAATLEFAVDLLVEMAFVFKRETFCLAYLAE